MSKKIVENTAKRQAALPQIKAFSGDARGGGFCGYNLFGRLAKGGLVITGYLLALCGGVPGKGHLTNF